MELFVVLLQVFGPPAISLIWFTVSLVKYIGRDKTDMTDCRRRKKRLIISSVVFGVITLALTVLLVRIPSSLYVYVYTSLLPASILASRLP